MQVQKSACESAKKVVTLHSHLAIYRSMKLKATILFLILVICLSCADRTVIENYQLREAVAQVWLNADLAQKLLDKINMDALSEYEQQRYRLAETHLMLKRELRLPSATDLDALASYFEKCGDEPSASEAYYIQGAYLNWLGANTRAMQYLKKAESYPATSIIRGMIYYKMGRISENEQLYKIAAENYEKALPFLEEAGLPLYLASVYRELGRNSKDENRDLYFEKALSAARFTGDSILYMDIRYAQLAISQPNAPEIARICQYMCHQAERKRYAYDLVKYYIRMHKADSAKVYLDILSADTTAQIWSEQQHTLWKSQYLYLKGRKNEAYELLYDLYNAYYKEVEEQGRASAFIVAQHFDNEEERAKNLQLQLDKQRLYVILALVLIGVLGILILAILFITRQRAKHMVENVRSQQEIVHLKEELNIRRNSLKRVMNQRIELNKNLQEALLSRRKEEDLPQWAKAFVEQNVFSTEKQWQQFMNEFQEGYGDILHKMQMNYPKLTTTDLQVIALYILGIDNADICLLTGCTQRTIWSRRMRIKSRIGLGEKESLDEWICGYAREI